MMHFIKDGGTLLSYVKGGRANGIRFTLEGFAVQSNGGKEQEYFVLKRNRKIEEQKRRG